MDNTVDEFLSDNELPRRLGRDSRKAVVIMSDSEAKFAVDMYYNIQKMRLAVEGQIRSLDNKVIYDEDGNKIKVIKKADRPPEEIQSHEFLDLLLDDFKTSEGNLKKSLDAYTDTKYIGCWLKRVKGIGPVLAAGLLAHIDINKAPTAGHIWSYAGIAGPDQVWEKGKKRPWNAELKTLCWKIGQSFIKVSGRDSLYGQIYKERHVYESARNENGGNKDYAENALRTRKIGKDTEQYKAYIKGKLPASQLVARASRYAVKIFLSHLQAEMYRYEFGKEPPIPFAIAHLGHAHYVEPEVPSFIGEWRNNN